MAFAAQYLAAVMLLRMAGADSTSKGARLYRYGSGCLCQGKGQGNVRRPVNVFAHSAAGSTLKNSGYVVKGGWVEQHSKVRLYGYGWVVFSREGRLLAPCAAFSDFLGCGRRQVVFAAQYLTAVLLTVAVAEGTTKGAR
jgi:hypothetical protein